MGSSTRKIRDKIQKILRDYNSDETKELNNVIPELTITVLRSRKTKKHLEDKDFANLLQGGIVGVTAIKQGTYKEYYDFDEDIENISQKDRLTVHNLLDAILDKIEEKEDIESNLILKAFRVSMTKVLLDSEKEIDNFIKDFSCNVLYFIVMEDINEAIYDEYKTKHTKDYEDEVKNNINQWIENKFKGIINKFLNNEIKLEEFIKQLVDNTSKVKGNLEW